MCYDVSVANQGLYFVERANPITGWLFALEGDVMNFVEPIRDKDMVEKIANYLKGECERDYIMFMTGLYTGLRISDILKLKVGDVTNKDNINIREQKTKKQKIIKIHPILKKLYKPFCFDKSYDEYLISSNQNEYKPISRVWAYKILKSAAKAYGIENIGTHTMRKTFGYHFYLENKDVVTLQKIFNHSAPIITLRYIGIEQESINKAIEKFKIF